MSFGAIIVAAGKSQRMGGQDKLLQPLAGRPLISHSIAKFASYPDLDGLVIVASEANHDQIAAIAAELAPEAQVVQGGRAARTRCGPASLP